jgi:hypothetical protein
LQYTESKSQRRAKKRTHSTSGTDALVAAGRGALFNQSGTWHAVIKVVSQSNALVRNRTDEFA